MKESRDILTLFEALSSHEVFTPPRVARAMLDLLPEELWSDPTIRLLDPCTKSGVFLREAFFRFFSSLPKGEHIGHDGLVYDLGDAKQRINHILKNMLYGIAISELTSYMSRRTLYGVMHANTDKQIASIDRFQESSNYESWDEDSKYAFIGRNTFNDHFDHTLFCVPEYAGFESEGNIFYPVSEVERKVVEGGSYEIEDTYYPFILDETQHQKIKDIRSGKLKFDVIVGNPPYQISDGGNSRSAKPVYQDFVNQAKSFNPRHLVMITPSRWFVGGKGLDDYRSEMMEDQQIRTVVDYMNARDVFPGVDVAGGISYFHWERGSSGPAQFISNEGGESSKAVRCLNEFPVIIRSNQSVEILRKVIEATSSLDKLSLRVLPRKPFGIPTSYESRSSGVPCWFIQRIGLQFANPNDISDPHNVKNKWKLLMPKAPIAGQTDFSKPIKFYYSGNVRIAKPGEVCTESWIVAGAFDTEHEVENYKRYIFTKTARFLLLLGVISQDVTRQNFRFVPDLMDYSKEYTDEELIEMWGLTPDQWKVIDNKIQSTE